LRFAAAFLVLSNLLDGAAPLQNPLKLFQNPPIHPSAIQLRSFKMDHLLIIAADNGVPRALLQSLKTAGWRITVTADITAAKQLLQRGDVAGVVIELNARHDPERLKILRFVQEFCPKTVVIMMQSGADTLLNAGHMKLAETLDVIDGSQIEKSAVSLDLYRLSPAQKRIAVLVSEAYPNREIARRLKIKEQSVRNELSRIFKKMGVWNRVELALLMRKTEGPVSRPQRETWNSEFKPAVTDSERNKTVAM
jgi:DNA-binding CsgD family transcriptional regulator